MATTNRTLTKAEPIALPPLPWGDNALDSHVAGRGPSRTTLRA
jgi:hypothetical protein